MEHPTDQNPEEAAIDEFRWRSRRRFAIVAFAVMILLTSITVGYILTAPVEEIRFEALTDMLFPVYTLFGGVIGAYMGVDAVQRYSSRRSYPSYSRDYGSASAGRYD